MKKFLALTLALVMSLSLVACGGQKTDDSATTDDSANTETPTETTGEYKLAMITDYGDITDQSFNQTTYEACKKFAEDNSIEFSYFKPVGDNTADRVAMIEKAVDEGFNVIVMPGYAFGGAIVETAPMFEDVKFIALDVSAGDLGEGFEMPANLYCAVYQEELCGYMAGYAAVKMGYKNLGFLGGMAVPAVVRYGYGFVQGVDAAAAEMGLTDVKVNYVYGGQFFGDADITAKMDTWYQSGTEVVFACGGGIYTSAVDAAKKVGAKVIGVDVDQAGVIASYAAGDDADEATVAACRELTVTSAMKGLYPTTYDTLNDVINNGNWDTYSGKIATLGLVSGDDPELNYVQIPMGEGTQWSDSFTQDDYKAMVKAMFDGELTVSNDTSKAPTDFATVITVDDQGAIKG